jgi:hypothetical protein
VGPQSSLVPITAGCFGGRSASPVVSRPALDQRTGPGHPTRRSGAWAITDWNYWVEVDATTTITYVQTRIVAMPGRYFLPRQRQLEVWTQIGFGIVNEFIGLCGGDPISAPDGVGAFQRRGR